jgi:PBSX family phage terminase large subunit
MFYGGSRSGKTFIALWAIIFRALKKKSRHAIFRFRFNHVKTSIWYDTLPKVLQICYPGLPVKENKSDWFIEFENGSQIWFGGFDDKERVEKILGNEYSTLYANECSQISYQAILVALTRLAEDSGLTPKFLYDCNPPSKKHWTYKLFIDGKEPESGKPIKKENYGVILMNPKDNESNLPKGYIENILENLPKKQRDRFLKGLFLTDTEGALWSFDMISKAQLLEIKDISKTIIAVDPAVTSNEDSSETGITAISLSDDKQSALVEADYSLIASPNTWAQAAVNAYHKHEAAYIVAEVNQGGDLVESVINNIDPTIKVKKVRASKGKFARAEPVAQLYEKNKIAHAPGLDLLENQLSEYVPLTAKKSPDRLDSLVWGITDLMLNKKQVQARWV